MSPEEERLKQWLTVLNEPDAVMSKIAAEKLGEMHSMRPIPDLIRAMQHRTTLVAAASALALGKIRDNSATPALIQTLLTHQDVVVQTAAAESLGVLKTTEAVPALRKIVYDHIETYKNDRFNLTRGMSRGLFTTAIQSCGRLAPVKLCASCRQSNTRAKAPLPGADSVPAVPDAPDVVHRHCAGYAPPWGAGVAR